MRTKLWFTIQVIGLSGLIGAVLLPGAGFGGLLLYSVLDPHVRADDLASLMLFFLPLAVLGLPALLVASRLALLSRRPALQLLLYGSVSVMATLGFAGFWVGAMGI